MSVPDKINMAAFHHHGRVHGILGATIFFSTVWEFCNIFYLHYHHGYHHWSKSSFMKLSGQAPVIIISAADRPKMIY